MQVMFCASSDNILTSHNWIHSVLTSPCIPVTLRHVHLGIVATLGKGLSFINQIIFIIRRIMYGHHEPLDSVTLVKLD